MLLMQPMITPSPAGAMLQGRARPGAAVVGRDRHRMPAKPALGTSASLPRMTGGRGTGIRISTVPPGKPQQRLVTQVGLG